MLLALGISIAGFLPLVKDRKYICGHICYTYKYQILICDMYV